jgi:hypothetical protein
MIVCAAAVIGEVAVAVGAAAVIEQRLRSRWVLQEQFPSRWVLLVSTELRPSAVAVSTGMHVQGSTRMHVRTKRSTQFLF